jgi:hypothetical protein
MSRPATVYMRLANTPGAVWHRMDETSIGTFRSPCGTLYADSYAKNTIVGYGRNGHTRLLEGTSRADRAKPRCKLCDRTAPGEAAP